MSEVSGYRVGTVSGCGIMGERRKAAKGKDRDRQPSGHGMVAAATLRAAAEGELARLAGATPWQARPFVPPFPGGRGVQGRLIVRRPAGR